MIDLHTHILPHMDDGSASLDESEQMLRTLTAQGAQIVVATPHFRATAESPREFLQRRQAAKLSWKEGMLLLGAEVAFFNGISRCEELPLLCIEGTNLLLLEMPFVPWSRAVVDEVCKIHLHLGLRVVLAHIERYQKLPEFRQSVSQMLENGVLLQCSADALVSFCSGRRILRMINDGVIHFVGTDCHNMHSRPPQLDRAVKRMEQKLGKQRTFEFFARARELLEG